MLRYLTAGESHGRCLTAILEGMIADLSITEGFINKELARRQVGYGRGGRMAIEKDSVEITSGVRFGETIGSPIAMNIKNKDWKNWEEIMNIVAMGNGQWAMGEEVTKPRPGHADLAGALKYDHRDIRNILERSSARETAARVAVGAVCKRFLEEFGIKVMSWVTEIGGAKIIPNSKFQISNLEEIFLRAEESDVRCPDKKVSEKMRKAIDSAKKNGDSVGGIFEVAATGVPPGLGSHVQWDRKLDARLAIGLMSIQAIKGVEVGIGFENAKRFGSEAHDEIFYKKGSRAGTHPKDGWGVKGSGEIWPVEPRFFRKTNNAGGIEGGMSNGEPIILRAAMKPIPTLYKPLRSVDMETKKPFKASIERSDICAVPAASVIGEAVTAFEIANVFLEKFGGDSVKETKRNYQGYLKYVKDF
ncbi:MAG: chorismate synthase [Deltaproteobacteria bacterium]|nr:chorismate synthase [Deltaproteobacteria bacterium]